MKKLGFATLLLLACALVCATAIAQTSSATLGGTVTDASGALIPGVSRSGITISAALLNGLAYAAFQQARADAAGPVSGYFGGVPRHRAIEERLDEPETRNGMARDDLVDMEGRVAEVLVGGNFRIEVPGGNKSIIVFRPDTPVGWSF